MTEMAPEGYVGVSPVCILGFNKVYVIIVLTCRKMDMLLVLPVNMLTLRIEMSKPQKGWQN